METKKLKRKLVLLCTMSFIASIAPLAVAVCMNADKWFCAPRESVKIGIGALIAIFLIALKAVGKLKMPRRIITFAVVFAMVYFLESLLTDLLLLSGMALFGEALDLIFFQAPIKRTREQILIGKTSDATAGKVEELLEKYVGSGRT